jgi:hypothetical protein
MDTDQGSTPAGNETASPNASGPLAAVRIAGTTLVVELIEDAGVDQVNLIQPNGESFGQREVATGAQQVSFELGTAYDPGEYEVVALNGEESIVEVPTLIQPEIRIRDVDLYRNNPEKPWDEVYGETETDRLKFGAGCVILENTGSGPSAAVGLVFSGDVPNPVNEPRGSGMYETEQVVVAPDETANLFSNSFPFGSTAADGMGCSPDGNSGQFTVTVETSVDQEPISNTFDVQYSGATDMSDCEVTISES